MITQQKKQNIITAFTNCGASTAVPIWELEFQIWDIIGNKPVLLGGEFAGLTAAEQERALHANAEVMIEVAAEMNFAAITAPGNYWEIAPGEPAFYWLPDKARLRQTEILAKMAGDNFIIVANSGGVMCMPPADSYIDFSYKLFDAPEDIDKMAEDTLAAGIEKAKRFRDAGAEAMFSASDIADNRGMFFSPGQMQRYILPYLNKWVEAVRSMDAYSIIHSDGDLSDGLESIAASGVDALQAIDPVAGMSMEKVRDKIGGQLCLCGNIDCGLLLIGNPEQIYLATRQLLESRKNDSRFVLGAANAVQREIPEENYRAMIEAWKHYGNRNNE